jgi:ribosomal protein S7
LREALKQVLTHLENTLMIEGKTKKNEELLEEYLQTYGGEV